MTSQFLRISPLYALLPEAKKRLIDQYTQAHQHNDVTLFLQLVCWDGVDEDGPKMVRESVEADFQH